MDEKEQIKDKLIKQLQAAYSGERAAALAYQGHWKSVKDLKEKQEIQKIEKEEWIHRELVRNMLTELNAEPVQMREIIFGTIGNTLNFLCPISGWFLPMFFAGKLESANVQEYEVAANYANQLGYSEMAEELMKMSKVELEHEEYFYQLLENHPFYSVFKYFDSHKAFKSQK